MLVQCLAMGSLAAIAVYAGDAFEWPHFNRREGYVGSEFMRATLYAIHIVAALWFCYTALATAIILWSYNSIIEQP